MKKVLVTGGAGFLGSHLCERLLEQGNHVTCLDNYSTGRPENVAHLLDRPHFEAIAHDITTPIDLAADEIYNLASPASPVKYRSQPVETVLTNVLGMHHMLQLAQRHNAKILQTSTSEVYGDPKVHPQTEDYFGNVNPIGLRACYDEGKRCAETLCFDYHREYGVNIKVVRIFNTYGPRMCTDDGRVVSNFIAQALAGRPITVHGDGSQTRSFCYVSDMVEGLITMMATDNTVTGPVNLGNPEEITIKEAAEIITEITKSSSKIIHTPALKDDPRLRRPDISLARKLLDWAPKVSLREGLQQTIQAQKNLIRPSSHSLKQAKK